MSWGPRIDLQYDDEEMADNYLPAMTEKPKYPYGTQLSLTGRELEMAQLPLPKVGDTIDMRCFGCVTSVRSDENGQRVEIQIEQIRLENEDDEDDEEDDDD